MHEDSAMNPVFRFFPAMVLFALLCFQGAALADDWADKTITGKEAENILNMLANSGWIADGPDNGKHLYVLFTATCGYCEMLYDKTRALTDEVQLRWIPMDSGGDLDRLYENPVAQSVKNSFDGQLPDGVDPEKAARIRQYTIGGVIFYIANQTIVDNPSRFGFPTLLYGEGDKLSVIVGMPQDMPGMIKSIPQGKADDQGFVPAAYAFADRKVELLAIKSLSYSNNNQENTSIRMMPFDDAPRLGSALPGTSGIPVLGVTENGYAVVSFDGSNPHIYVQDKDFVQKELAAAK